MLIFMNSSSNKKTEKLPRFNKEQWLFLAVIEVFRKPVSIDIAGKLVPLTPGPLIELLKICESEKWIKRTKTEYLSITDRLPLAVRKKLDAINSKKYLSELADRIQREKLSTWIDPDILAKILLKAGRCLDAGLLAMDMAKDAFEKQNPEQQESHLAFAVSCLATQYKEPDFGDLFISATLQWSNVSFSLGKVAVKIEPFLHKALDTAEMLGDIRSRALLNLCLGRLYYFTDRRDDALVALSMGRDGIEELGDRDIQEQSAALMGIYFFILGKHEQAFKYLERATQANEALQDPKLKDPMVPLFFGYCAAYTGKFHRAIGHLDHELTKFQEHSDISVLSNASTIRASLGTILALVGKSKEAQIHLKKAEQEAKQTQNLLGLYLTGYGMALDFFINKDMPSAHRLLTTTVREARKVGFIPQFSSPWILEMLYEFHQLGYDSIPSFELSAVMKKMMDSESTHLKGVCLRLKAKMIFGQSGAHIKIESFLSESEKRLRESGDPVQISKTLLEIARLEFVKGKRNKALKLVQEARQMLGGYAGDFLPEEYKHLIETKDILFDKSFDEEDFLDKFIEMLESLHPIGERMEIFSKIFSATSQIFGAERAGLFWFPRGEHTKTPELRFSLNLSKTEIDSINFKPSMNFVLEAQIKKIPISEEIVLKKFSLNKEFTRSVLSIPIEIKGKVHGIIYYDNSYLGNAFEFLNLSLAKKMVRLTSIMVEQSLGHMEANHKADRLASEKKFLFDSRMGKIITQSKKMYQLLDQIDNVACTESSILVLGETGTGKELIAQRIHEKSLRKNGPFIIVDSTTIPENLIESELFGHEKGSFTGADKLKIGCIEMADKGTLFLDEVGELPLSAQAKLLRTLQEKTIRRVGGAMYISADFRLVAATNRDLAAEVKQGNFREDLYYRLNVVPFKLPPLRNRGEDPAVLSHYFIDRYAKKYHFQGLELSPTDKNTIMNYPWPGNIRELKNVMERAVLLSKGAKLEFDLSINSTSSPNDIVSDMPTLDELQRRYIQYVLDYTNGKASGPGGACEILDVKRPSFYSKMRSLKLRKQKK